MYFDVPTSTNDVVTVFNSIVSDFGGGAILQFVVILLTVIFGFLLIGYALKVFTSR